MAGLRASVRTYLSGGRTLEAGTPDAVEDFVASLAEASADDAYIEHMGRPRQIDPDEGDEVGDHVLYLAVRDCWGYIRYLGPVAGHPEITDAMVPVGDPKSPMTHGTFNVDYLPTTGVSLPLLKRALKEFIETAELPTCLTWAKESEVENNERA